jgi:hypothetical protein
MPRYQYPNVPQLPGVPQVNRSNAFPASTPPQLGGALALGRLAQAFLQKNVWGIFRDFSVELAEQSFRNANRQPGEPLRLTVFEGSNPVPVIAPDSFRTFNFKSEFDVTDAPTEAGGFASYNKVNQPFEIVVRLTKSSSRRARAEFLETLESISRSLNLYKVVTDVRVYERLNIVRYEIRRDEARGAHWLNEVDVYFREIRIVSSEYSNTATNTANAKSPGASPTANTGTVQPVVPSDAQAAAAGVP